MLLSSSWIRPRGGRRPNHCRWRGAAQLPTLDGGSVSLTTSIPEVADLAASPIYSFPFSPPLPRDLERPPGGTSSEPSTADRHHAVPRAHMGGPVLVTQRASLRDEQFCRKATARRHHWPLTHREANRDGSSAQPLLGFAAPVLTPADLGEEDGGGADL